MIKLKDLLEENKFWVRKFGEPLPTIHDYAKKYENTPKIEEQTPADVKRFKTKIKRLTDLEGKFRNAMYGASEVLRNSTETIKEAREIESAYKKYVTVFMRDLLKIERKVR